MSQPSPATNQEVIAGLIERVTFHNAENGFCVRSFAGVQMVTASSSGTAE